MEFLFGVIEGNLAIPVEVLFATDDGTAFGKLLRLLLFVYESLIYRIAGNFRGGFNLANWRIFSRIAKFKSADIKF